jgi:hypothetical protein
VDKIPGQGILINRYKQGHMEHARTMADIRSANEMRYPGSGEGKIRTEHETNKFENLKIYALEAKSIMNRIRWYGHILGKNVDRILKDLHMTIEGKHRRGRLTPRWDYKGSHTEEHRRKVKTET